MTLPRWPRRSWRACRARADEPWAIRWASWIVVGGGALTVGLAIAAVFWLPTWDRVVGAFSGADLRAARADLRDAGLKLATGVGVATAGLLTWGRLELSSRGSRRQDDDQRLRERAQLTERFGSAVELLGHTDTSVRLGALYALEALSKDSPGDRQTIYDVICAYARSHVPPMKRLIELQLAPLPADYEGAIDIALRAGSAGDIRLDLSTTILYRKQVAALSTSRLEQTTFSHCNFGSLQDCNLEGSRLFSCTFDRVELTHCRFDAASLTACTFSRGSALTGCTFNDRATLIQCRFLEGCRLVDCEFNSTQITQYGFYKMQLVNCRFNGAKLRNGGFGGSSLSGCKFAGASLVLTDLGGTILKKCGFRSTSLDRCSFLGASISECSWDRGGAPSTRKA